MDVRQGSEAKTHAIDLPADHEATTAADLASQQRASQVDNSPDTDPTADALDTIGEETDTNQMHGLDLSLTALLANRKDPDEDWDQTGWRNPRHLKALVAFLAKFGYRGHKHEQEIVRAALLAYLPDALVEISRDLARGGKLDDLAAEIEKRLHGK